MKFAFRALLSLGGSLWVFCAPGFAVADGLYEWVESAGAKRTVKKHGAEAARKDQAHPDVTFRLARDL